MADLHSEKCFCAGTGFLQVDDPREPEIYLEIPCPGRIKAKRRRPNQPKNKLAFVLPANEFVLSETDIAGKSAQVSHVTDGAPVISIRMWAWDLESKEWIILHGQTCHLSAEEVERLRAVLNEKATAWAGPTQP